MARPEKNTVEYFPFICEDGNKTFYIEETYGNDGFATFVKILRELAKTNYHYLDLSKPSTIMFLSAKCKVSKEVLVCIISDLVDLGKFNEMLWKENKIIWCQDFIDSIQDAYFKRKNNCILFDDLLLLLSSLGVRKPSLLPLKGVINTQTILEETILEETKPKEKKFSFKKSLEDLGVDKEIVSDWLTVRKGKGAVNTKIAFRAIENELIKCELELRINSNEAIKIAVEKSWSGFKTQWLKNELQKLKEDESNNKNGSNPNQGYKPAKVDREKLLRELAEDAENGNIPGVYN